MKLKKLKSQKKPSLKKPKKEVKGKPPKPLSESAKAKNQYYVAPNEFTEELQNCYY